MNIHFPFSLDGFVNILKSKLNTVFGSRLFEKSQPFSSKIYFFLKFQVLFQSHVNLTLYILNKVNLKGFLYSV